MAERDAVNLNLTRILSERFEAGLGFRAYTSRPIALILGDDSLRRTYVDLNARLIWNLSRTFALETIYRYTFVDREILGESANSNQLNLWIVYRPTGSKDRR